MKDLIIHFVGGSKKRIANLTEKQCEAVLDNTFFGRPSKVGTLVINADNVTWVEVREVEE